MTHTPLFWGLPRHTSGIWLLRHRDESVLCDGTGVRVCVLNETASALWELCDGSTTGEEMVDAVCLACAVDRDRAVHDIERALGELSRAGLIQWQ